MAKKLVKHSNVRTKKRDVRDKFMPTFESISKQLHNTGEVTDDFIGYKAPAGTIIDSRKREWQLQCSAVLSKKYKMKKDEIKPMIRKWAIGLKFRAIVKYIVDWSNQDK